MLLSRLHDRGLSSEREIAFGAIRRDANEFDARVAAVAGHVAAHGGGRWLLHCDDTFAFAVSLFGLAHGGGSAVLPPNRRPGTICGLIPGTVGMFCDAQRDLPTLPDAIDPLALGQADPAALAASPALDRDRCLIEAFTSGTTGANKPVTKALRHLEDEVEMLESRFGDRLDDALRVFSTVSHQHLYGLLFKLLWPLATGRAFHADSLLYPEEVIGRMHATAGPSVLAATPVHLERLAGRARFRALRGRCRAVFSSGGPLSERTALAVASDLGEAPLEILGSTETGGIALRQRRRPGDDLWQTFPRVSVGIRTDGRLVVRSPFVSVGRTDPGSELPEFVTGDCAELCSADRFRLLGRADRVVKIGEKRLHLPDMEERLRRDPRVDDVALLTIGRGVDTRVGAVLVVAQGAREELERLGRRRWGRQLFEPLLDEWDRTLLPRRWRAVEALPRDAQGKLPFADLRALFDAPAIEPVVERRADGARGAAQIEPLRVRRGEDWVEWDLEVPGDLACLDGHFPGHPVVPGVVQIGWALDALAELTGADPREACEIIGLKFHRFVGPASALTLRVECAPEADKARFRLEQAGRLVSEGRLRRAPEGCLAGAAAGLDAAAGATR